jgi:hypothetical protein
MRVKLERGYGYIVTRRLGVGKKWSTCVVYLEVQDDDMCEVEVT